MEKIIILAVLIVVMEFEVEGIKALVSNFPIWDKIKSYIIPFVNVICMAGLIIGTETTILNALDVKCNIYIDYLATILICSLGSAMWHEFRKKIKEAKEDKIEANKED